MKDIMIKYICLSRELKITGKRIKYFTHHLARCKKESDSLKLTLKLAFYTAYWASIVISIQKLREDIISRLIPKIPEQKLIEFKGGTMLND